MPLSSSASGSYYYPGINGNVYQSFYTSNITAKNTHLILSSSAGGIVEVSGALKFGQYTFATLPTAGLASTDTFSGTLVWVSDRNCFALYGPAGWQRLTSGTL